MRAEAFGRGREGVGGDRGIALQNGRRDSGHALAERAAWFTLAAAIVLVVWLGMRNVVARGVVAGSIAATVLFPYWILPGAGLIVIDVSLVRARIHRSMPTSG